MQIKMNEPGEGSERQSMRKVGPELWTLMTPFAVAGLVLAFGHIAEEVLEGDTTKFDQTVLLFSAAEPICPTLSGPRGLRRWRATLLP